MKPILIFITLSLLIGCSESSKQAGSQPASVTDSAMLPDADMTGVTIYLYSGGIKTTKVKADHIIKFDAQDSTVAYQLDIDIYDSLGAVSTNIVGDSGIIRESRNHLSIFGHVVVFTSDSVKLETERLFWNPRISKIETDAFVKITQNEDIMTGYGLEADQALHSFKILNQPSGTIQDAAKLQIE
jgi:LPS export ABC transporter protein LptC